jgi:hypothetical protein
VAEVQSDRSITRRPAGVKRDAYYYALTGLLWCDCCETDAAENRDITLRSSIAGTHKPNGYFYRHLQGHRCKGKVRSLPTEVIDKDFQRLLSLLTLRPEALPSMLDLSIRLNGAIWQRSDAELQQEKNEAIAKAQRKLEAARYLYEDGELSREEYLRRRESLLNEISHWEARTTKTEQLAKELALCVETLEKMNKLPKFRAK